MANLVGQQLGNYRIVRLLGQGAFADVYLAKHLHLNTKVAIKVLHTKLTRDERDGFLTEARILSLLAHPHIVRVLDYAVEDGSPYLVMEYAPHGTLRQRHPDSSPVPLDTVVSYVTQVASALQYAHDEKLIHRDVKPENLLVGKDHKILLSDFGFVTVSLSSRTEKVQDIAGTMAYMAPEQIQAHPSRASDQYALGIVIYEWLCGQRPFDGTLEEIAAKHMTVAPPSLHEGNPMLSPGVEMVVMRALEKDPSKRFAGIQEFAAAFEQACTLGLSAMGWREFFRRRKPSRAKVGNPDMPDPNVSTTNVSPQLPNEGYSAFMNQPVLGVVGGSGNFGLAGGFSANPGFSSQFSVGPVFSQDFSVQVLALSPSGESVAFGGWSEAIYVYHLAEEGKSFTYSGHSDRVFQLAWSPDGKFLVSVSNDNTVQVWDAATGDTLFTYDDHQMNFGTLAWSPDSICIASAIGDEVHVWDAITGNTLFTYRGHPKLVVTVAWSPDGKRIASSSINGTVQVWDISTGSTICTYYGHIDRVSALAWSPDGSCIVSGGYNSSVQVWNATNRRHILTARTHPQPRGVLLVGWSVDGKRLRVGYNDGFVEELDATTGDYVSFFHTQGHSGTFVNAMTWTPDGTCIAIGGEDRKVTVYDTVATTTFVCRAPAAPVEVVGTSSRISDQNVVQCIMWSPDNMRLASAKHDNTVQIWDATTGSHVFTWQVNSHITALAWSPDTTHIASGDPEGLVQIWNVATGKVTYTYRGHSEAIVTVAWAPDGKRLASCSYDWDGAEQGEDGTVQVWDTTIGGTFFTSSGKAQSIYVDSIAWSPDGKRLALGSRDGLVQVWDATNGDIIHSYQGHSDRIKTLAWSPDGIYFASGSNDAAVKVWDATTGTSIFTYQGHTDEVVNVAWSPDGKRISSSSRDNTVQTWDATSGGNVFVHQNHIRYVKDVATAAWNANGTSYAIGGNGREMLICDALKESVIVCNIPSDALKMGVVSNDEQRHGSINQGAFKEWGYDSDVIIYSGHRSTVSSLAWSPDSRRLVSGGHDSTVHVWDSITANLLFMYREHLDPVVTVAWSPKGQRIASGSLDHTVHVWDVVTGRTILIYRGHTNYVWSVTWSPDGERIASASEDGTVQVWDVNKGIHIFTYQGHSARVEAVSWSPDGKYIASGGGDRTVRVWDASTGKDIYIFHKHKDRVRSVAWSPDGKRIASGGEDKIALGRDDRRTLQVWDALDGENAIACGKYPSMMYALAWSPDGRYIASNEGPQVQVWNAATGDPVIAYHAHLYDEAHDLLHVSWSPEGTRLAASDQIGKIWVGSVDVSGIPI